MQKRIIYWVQEYKPQFEAISKEVELLHRHFKNSYIFNPISGWSLKKDYISFNFRRFPVPLLLVPVLELKLNISHVYTSLGNYFYLTLLRKKPIILTGAGPSSQEKIQNCLKKYKKLNKIIVESKKDLDMLHNLGVDDSKTKLIYPGINLNHFNYKKPKGKFNILFASSPLQKEQFHSKGVDLLKTITPRVNANFTFLWRGKFLKQFKEKEYNNVFIINKLIKDMNQIYAKAHAAIFPSREYLNTKPCPYSIIESLAAGKPVLVSNNVGISDLIKKEKCGLVFEPTQEDIIESIGKLKKNYTTYQKNCRRTAEKYFSKEKFLKAYSDLYQEL